MKQLVERNFRVPSRTSPMSQPRERCVRSQRGMCNNGAILSVFDVALTEAFRFSDFSEPLPLPYEHRATVSQTGVTTASYQFREKYHILDADE